MINCCKVSFNEKTLLRSPEKACNRVSTIRIFLSELRKQILQLIVNYLIM